MPKGLVHYYVYSLRQMTKSHITHTQHYSHSHTSAASTRLLKVRSQSSCQTDDGAGLHVDDARPSEGAHEALPSQERRHQGRTGLADGVVHVLRPAHQEAVVNLAYLDKEENASDRFKATRHRNIRNACLVDISIPHQA
jgi:hypothetical protein